jgi:hypothetical protein
MVRFVLRALGLMLLAAGFVGLVIDATRSIANSAVTFMPLRDLVATVSPRSLAVLEPTVKGVAAVLWDPVATTVLLAPAAVLGVVLGALLLWLGQKPVEPIGYLAGS